MIADDPGAQIDLTSDVTSIEGTSIERTIELDAAVDQVWQLASSAEGWATWLVDDARVEVRPGGRGEVTDQGQRRSVEVHEVDPGRRVSFSWHDDDGAASTVTIEVAGGPVGPTTVRIVERLAVTASATTTQRAAFDWEVRACLLWSCLVAFVHA